MEIFPECFTALQYLRCGAVAMTSKPVDKPSALVRGHLNVRWERCITGRNNDTARAMCMQPCVAIASDGFKVSGADANVGGVGMSQVLVRDVRKAYGAMEIIHGVNIDIADGEFVVLVGPSGCGKSTLLRMIAGLENITGGKIMIGEKVVNNVPPSDRDIAMVFQSYALYPHMKVKDNMAFSLKLKKPTPQWWKSA